MDLNAKTGRRFGTMLKASPRCQEQLFLVIFWRSGQRGDKQEGQTEDRTHEQLAG